MALVWTSGPLEQTFSVQIPLLTMPHGKVSSTEALVLVVSSRKMQPC